MRFDPFQVVAKKPVDDLVDACRALMTNYAEEKEKSERTGWHVINLDFRAMIAVYDALEVFGTTATPAVGEK